MIYNDEHGIHCKAGDFIKIGSERWGGAVVNNFYEYGFVERVYPIPEWEGDDELYVVRLANGETTHLDYAMTQQDIILARAENE